jgi:methylisocitrate lyase
MNKAAEKVYEVIRAEGTQRNLIHTMQTREELYERINYHAHEKALDEVLGKK